MFPTKALAQDQNARPALRQPDGRRQERPDHGLDRWVRQAEGRDPIGESRSPDC